MPDPRTNGIKIRVVNGAPVRIASGRKMISVQVKAKARKALARAGKLQVRAILFGAVVSDEQTLTLKRG